MEVFRLLEDEGPLGTTDPVWIDNAWLDTVVVVGITCFSLCLMGLATVSESCCQTRVKMLPNALNNLLLL